MGNLNPKGKGRRRSQPRPVSPDIAQLPILQLKFTRAWDLLYCGQADHWKTVAGMYGLDKYLYKCDSRYCIQDMVCTQYINGVIRRNRIPEFLDIYRYNQRTVTIPVTEKLKFYLSGSHQGSVALTHKAHLVLFGVVDKILVQNVFYLVDLQDERVVGVITALRMSINVVQWEITPDLQHTIIVCDVESETRDGYCYQLHLFSNEIMSLVKTFVLSHDVKPYITMDPRYCWSRAALANYESEEKDIKHELVIFSLDSGEVVKRSHLSLPLLMGGSFYNLFYSFDGTLLFLLKQIENRFDVMLHTDIYIFNSDQLQLIQYVSPCIPSPLYSCTVNYQPKFSKCGSLMRLLNYKADNTRDVMVQIYQLPRQLHLSSQCRVVILQNLKDEENVCDLPLPKELKNYLQFLPLWI